MSSWSRVTQSTVGLKFIIGLTGFLLAAFVFIHLLGNLQVYVGAEAVNQYAALLKSMPGPLWAARLGLLAIFGIHVVANGKLHARNRRARRVPYETSTALQSTAASRSMFVTGVALLAFVAYHLAHFTLGLTDPDNYSLHDELGRHDVYSMLVLGFQQPLVSALYVIAMGFLGLHLYHGLASVFQTAGLRTLTWRDLIDGAGRLVALLVVLGNISIPLACLVGILKPAQGVF